MFLKILLSNKLVILPDNGWPYDAPIRPTWWREDHVCSYHRSKGHNNKNFFELKDVIQDLIIDGKFITDGLAQNSDHNAFKQPLLEYEKWESSKVNKKNYDAKVNYTYTNTDIIEPIEYLCMMDPKFHKEPSYDIDDERPKVVLKMHNTQQNIGTLHLR